MRFGPLLDARLLSAVAYSLNLKTKVVTYIFLCPCVVDVKTSKRLMDFREWVQYSQLLLDYGNWLFYQIG